MASSVSWDGLRELAGFQAERGCAISVYLDLDPSVSPTAGEVQTRLNSLLDEGEKSNGANRRDLSHDQRQSLKADFERIRSFVSEDFNRDGAHGLATFCAGLDNFWRTITLSDSVPDGIRVGRNLYLAPLVPLVGRGEGALVAVVGRERGDIFRLRAGRLEELERRFDEQPGRHDQGGWSQARYQRHIENLVHEHLRDVAAELDRQVRRLRAPRVVLVSSEETRAEFGDLLSNQVRSAVVGWTQAEAHAQPAELLALAAPVLERWRGEKEAECVDRWREEAGRNGRAAGGWEQTLEAASDGRVELLLYQDGTDHPAWQCPACGRVAVTGGKCPLDGTELEPRDEGLDLAVHQTLSHGGTVWALRQHRDLEPVEGIGALLRY
jgi:peptide chain release factor subunit 1